MNDIGILHIKTSCKLCGAEDLKEIKNVKDSNHFVKGNWKLVKCTNCTVYYIIDPPSGRELEKYYPHNKYYTHVQPEEDSKLLSMVYDYYYRKDSGFSYFFIYFLLKRAVNMFPQKISSCSNPSLLDIGCGNGKLMLRFSKYGFRCTGYEVDLNSIKVAKNNNLKVYFGDFFSIDFGKKFDVIIMNQVLEHIDNPFEFLKRVKNILKPKGQLIISVPNSACIDFHILRDCWTSFQAPTHISHYKKKTLKMLLKRVGFEIRSVAYSTSIQTLDYKYIRKNLSNVTILKKNLTKQKYLIKLLFLLSSVFSIIPGLSKTKRKRITVYCNKLH